MFDVRNHIPRLRPFLLSLAIVLLIAPLAQAQVQIKVGDNTLIKFGILAQGWADTAQDPATKAYANNLFLRRIRFLVGGQISPNVSFFFETDNPNLGKATTAGTTTTKVISTGFTTQDAFVEWKPTGKNTFMIDAGLMLPPLCRNCVESAASLLSLDYGTYSFVESAPTQSVVGRDTGFLAKGYLAGGHFEYRGGVFQGFRSPGSRNAFRTTGRLMYNVFDVEAPGYTWPGVYLGGNKKVLALGGGLDKQRDYKAYSADVFTAMPFAKNEVNGELTLLHFDGGKFLTAIPQQRDATAQVGYYVAGVKVMPWIRFEKKDVHGTNTGDENRQQAGLTWYPSGHNFNVKGAYSRVNPRVGNKTNEYTVQMQFFYY